MRRPSSFLFALRQACRAGLLLAGFARAEVTPFPAPGDLAGISHLGRCAAYEVTVRGQAGGERPLFVYVTSNYWEHKARRMQEAVSFASFFLADEAATVNVTCAKPVTSAILRPKSHGIEAKVDGRQITFRMDRPRQIALEIDGGEHPLLIFGEKPETVDAGATRFFPSGSVTKIGDKVPLKEGESVYVAAGAVVEGTFSLLGNRIRMRGRGIVSSGHVPWKDWDADKSLTQFGSPKWRTGKGDSYEGLILLNSPGWWLYGDMADSTARDLKFIAWNGNSDGLHLGGNSLLEGCFFFINDDALIANSGNGNTWRNCIVWRSPWGHPIISLLTKRTSRDYLWENIDVISTEGTGPVVTLKNYRNWGVGGVMENFTVRNLRVEGPRKGPLIRIEAAACTVKNFTLENVRTETRLRSEGLIALPEEAGGSGVRFRDVRIAGDAMTSLGQFDFRTEGDASGVVVEP